MESTTWTVSLIAFLDGNLSACSVFSPYGLFTVVLEYILCKADAWVTHGWKVV